MDRGVLGTGPDGNNRKRSDTQAAYISSMMHGNPKLLLAESPLFKGLTQHQLPFTVHPIKASSCVQYQARIRLAFPDGREAFGIGVARTKKESERVAAIDACMQLQGKGLLIGVKKSSVESIGWGENPKNALVTSVAFRDVCSGGNARALPITLRSSGPDHAKTFVAELTVPLRSQGDLFVAVGKGPNKAEAERACCTAACEKLHDVGLLQKPIDKGACPPSTKLPTPTKALNDLQAASSFQIEELSMMEEALQRLQLEKFRLEMGEPHVSLQPRLFQRNCSGEAVPKEQLGTENAIMRLEARKRLQSSEFAEQRRARQSFPAWRERRNIVDAVSSHRVVVLTGETGSGRTTQVPQFVLEEAELQGSGADVHIVVTQPHRIAAISVAERVAWERGEAVGKSVGYAMPLEISPPRARGSILYCTTRMLLHSLQRADGLVGVSHVIIDEVHERDMDTDLSLVVIRELLNRSASLRVVVMTTTLNASLFTRYFGGCPLVYIPGKAQPVKVYNLDDLPQLMGRFLAPTSIPTDGSSLFEEDVDVDLTISVIVWVSQIFAEGDGAILCFLPGWNAISIIRDRLLNVTASRSMMIVPLHSQLTAGEHRAAFARAPTGMRKVLLATDIAETTLTIEDVVYVVDSGKIEEKQYGSSRNLAARRVQWTSQASVRQRQGRAGSLQAGFCFQLYSKSTFLSMFDHQNPEMYQAPLEELCQNEDIFSPSATIGQHKGHRKIDGRAFYRLTNIDGEDFVHGSLLRVYISFSRALEAREVTRKANSAAGM